jgi:hypothetical protein
MMMQYIDGRVVINEFNGYWPQNLISWIISLSIELTRLKLGCPPTGTKNGYSRDLYGSLSRSIITYVALSTVQRYNYSSEGFDR